MQKSVFNSPYEYKWQQLDEKTENDIVNQLLGIMHNQRKQPDIWIVGLKQVTKHLQNGIQNAQDKRIKVVFLCKGDEPVLHLYSHIPTMCHLYKDVKLVTFGPGVEKQFADKMQMKTCLCFALTEMPFDLSKIPICQVQWLTETIVLPTRVRVLELPQIQNRKRKSRD
ncbi:hypothetical protein EDD86DRAFT_197815 [Gorgonomyces haynaldii]|nr:hypothetical protein EDD86DRAFT_197815 [Gorgonomyces haynaldii]